jgi:hypothetical protein
VVGQYCRNSLFLQAFIRGHARGTFWQKVLSYQVLTSCTERVKPWNPTRAKVFIILL